MNACTRWSAIVVAVLGVVGLVFGIIFITQAGSSEKEIAESIQPITLTELDATYEAVKAKQMDIRAAEEPNIQAKTAAPSTTYNYLTVQRTALGLARTSIGLAAFVRTSGIIDIIVGLGLILAGVGLFKKSRSEA
ncbi:unnamed protein product [marine sediment metagenome]|uniref:Uncharacterized protein n=1 Tax=marine sediment metagenome TaxID=412755 RepID=X1SAM2_9ZZZZ